MSEPRNHPQPSDEPSRLDELLAERALFGLGGDEQRELALLEREHRGAGGPAGDESFDWAIGAAIVSLGVAEAMPEELRRRVLAGAPGVTTPNEAAAASRDRGPLAVEPVARPGASPRWAPLGLLALAATLLAAAWLGAPRAEPDAAALRERLLASAPDVTRVAWTANEDPAISAEPDPGKPGRADRDWGDVVWSDARQEGYLRLRGLASNDPEREQYQLWIFDAQRDDRFPIDGGVFDVPPGAVEAVTPIDAKLLVGKAVMFAVTVERPGGVVVSGRERLPLLAKR